MNRYTHGLYDLIIGVFSGVFKHLFPKSKIGIWAKQRGQYFVQNPIKKEQSEVVFFCSSHGEFEIIRELLKTVRKSLPSCYIHLLFFSNSGYQFVINETWAFDRISLAPLDKINSINAFLHDRKPKAIIITANAIWPSLIAYFQKRALPYLFVNSSFDGNGKWAKALYFKLMRPYLLNAQNIYLENEESQKYLQSIGITNTQAILSLRWDALLEFRKNIQPIKNLDWVKRDNNKVLVCGSTYQEDELLIAQAIKELEDWIVIIAPHHVSKSRINEIKNNFPEAVLFSEFNISKLPSVMVIDQIGLLKSLYQYADAAYIGGAYNNALHNVLEPAVWEIPVLYCPLSNKSAELRAIESCGIGQEVMDAIGFSTTLQHLDSISMNPCYSDSQLPSGIPLIMKEIETIVK